MSTSLSSNSYAKQPILITSQLAVISTSHVVIVSAQCRHSASAGQRDRQRDNIGTVARTDVSLSRKLDVAKLMQETMISGQEQRFWLDAVLCLTVDGTSEAYFFIRKLILWNK